MARELPADWDKVIAQWREGILPHGRMAVWVSRHLGELLNDDPLIEELKDLARDLADKMGSAKAVKGFEIDGATTFSQTYADLKGLMLIKDTLEGMCPEAWSLIEKHAIKTRQVSRRASVRFTASPKAQAKERKRKERLERAMEEDND
jgi:hypothetical protein